MSYLFGLHENLQIPEEDLEILIEYADEKMMQGCPIDLIITRLKKSSSKSVLGAEIEEGEKFLHCPYNA